MISTLVLYCFSNFLTVSGSSSRPSCRPSAGPSPSAGPTRSADCCRTAAAAPAGRARDRDAAGSERHRLGGVGGAGDDGAGLRDRPALRLHVRGVPAGGEHSPATARPPARSSSIRRDLRPLRPLDQTCDLPRVATRARRHPPGSSRESIGGAGGFVQGSRIAPRMPQPGPLDATELRATAERVARAAGALLLDHASQGGRGGVQVEFHRHGLGRRPRGQRRFLVALLAGRAAGRRA